MLGLCWKPAAIQGMQKVASSMPSNPEQLLGAILVRRDIFQRFESTMQDTCLDANNLLEYLFSLYNSTATPAERENFQPNPNLRAQQLNAAATRPGGVKKSSHHSPHVRQMSPKGGHHNPSANAGSGQVQGVPTELMVSGGGDGSHNHRKRAKVDINQTAGHNHNNVSHHHTSQQQQQQTYSNLLRPFDTNPSVFPGSNNIKMEMAVTHDGESRLTQSSSPLPPFSQIRRQGRPFSPGSAHQGMGPMGTPTDTSSTPKFGMDSSLDHSAATDTSMDHSDSSPNKKSTPLKDSNSGLPRRKRPKRHQCFCGALFTRADNLKRHIRKCHEEKLEKLTSGTPGAEGEQVPTSGATFVDDFQQLYPAAAQDLQQQQQEQQQQQQQQHAHQLPQEQQDHHHLQQQQQHHQQLQQQQQQPRPHHPDEQPHNVLNDVGDLTINKSAPAGGVKWSCFCGESFEDHRQLVEHTRIHDANP